MKSFRRWFLLGLGLAISTVSLYLALKELSLQEVWLDLQTARYGWILP